MEIRVSKLIHPDVDIDIPRQVKVGQLRRVGPSISDDKLYSKPLSRQIQSIRLRHVTSRWNPQLDAMAIDGRPMMEGSDVAGEVYFFPAASGNNEGDDE